MSNNSVEKLSKNIDNLINEINNSETINCSKNSELIGKSYELFQAVSKKCSLEELNSVFNTLFDNLYHDTIGKPINKTKKQINDIYKKTFYTIPDLIKKIKIHIKNPEFLKEFKPLLEPFAENLSVYICEKYGPDKVESTLNNIFASIGNSFINGASNALVAIPGVASAVNAAKGVTDTIGNTANTINEVAKITKNEDIEKMEKVIDKYDKLDNKLTDNTNINKKINGGGKKIIKKCSNILCFIISDYLNYIIKKSQKKSKKKSKKKLKKRSNNKLKKKSKKKLKKNKSTKKKLNKNKKKLKKNKKTTKKKLKKI